MSASPAVRLGVKELEARLGVERSTIWRWYKAGAFPSPHFIAERRVWWLHEVETWERERMARPLRARRGAANLNLGVSDRGTADATGGR